jgi:hypothetical protein
VVTDADLDAAAVAMMIEKALGAVGLVQPEVTLAQVVSLARQASGKLKRFVPSPTVIATKHGEPGAAAHSYPSRELSAQTAELFRVGSRVADRARSQISMPPPQRLHNVCIAPRCNEEIANRQETIVTATRTPAEST